METQYKFSTLYKCKRGDKPLMWEVEVNKNSYTIRHGQVGGAIQEKTNIVKEGKNIGKKNETTPEQQAYADAESAWNKQIDRKGYAITLGNAWSDPIRPMLAYSYKDYKHKVNFPCLIQPKLDGIRCTSRMISNKIQLHSRTCNQFKILTHIEEHLHKMYKAFGLSEDFVFDGELYTHEENFEDIISGVKRETPNEYTHKIQYFIYDIVDLSNPDMLQSARVTTLRRLRHSMNTVEGLHNSGNRDFPIQFVSTNVARDDDDIDEIVEAYLNEGYEGGIIRNMGGVYKQDKRSSDLLKVKYFKDEEFEIVYATENLKNPGTCVFVCKTKDGDSFSVMPEGSQAHRSQLWRDWSHGVIKPGMMLTVKYFEMTNPPNPVPRKAVGKTIRNYE